MAKPKSNANNFVSGVTVQDSSDNIYKITRDTDGDYKIDDVCAENTMYINAAAARELIQGLGMLLDFNDE